MSDPLADMLIEQTVAEESEREEQRILMERITELRQAVANLAEKVELLLNMERAEQGPREIEVTGRDAFDRITTFRLH